MRNAPSTGDPASTRLRFPQDEARLPWLPLLLEAYAIVDHGVAVAIRETQARAKTTLACSKGCDHCCRTHTDIPLYPHELVGIYWFATEKITGQKRLTLKAQLSSHKSEDPCPFVMDCACSIHPLRPTACRQFNVFGKPCAPGEDPYYTRRHDVLTPIQDYTNRAFLTMFPFYGLSLMAGGSAHALIQRIIHTQVVNLKEYDWKKLLRVMDQFDAKHP